MGDIMNLFNYYLDNPSQEGEVYNGNFLFLKCLAHYQTGKVDQSGKVIPLWVDANSIDLGILPEKTGVVGRSLFHFSDANLKAYDNFADLSDEGLALGKIDLLSLDDRVMIFSDTYDFNVESDKFTLHTKIIPFIGSLFTGRNAGNAISWSIHNILVPLVRNRPAHGPFTIYFSGEIKK